MGDRLRALLRAETLAVALIVLCPVVGIAVGGLTTGSSAPAGGGGADFAVTVPAEPAQPASSGAAPAGTEQPVPAAALPAPAQDDAPAVDTGDGVPIPVVSRREVEELLEGARLSDTDELILSELDRRGRLGLLFPGRTGPS